jgi:hypothetical protein
MPLFEEGMHLLGAAEPLLEWTIDPWGVGRIGPGRREVHAQRGAELLVLLDLREEPPDELLSVDIGERLATMWMREHERRVAPARALRAAGAALWCSPVTPEPA